MKRFKTKKKRRTLKLLLFILIIISSFYTCLTILIKNIKGYKIDNEKLLKYLIKEGFNNQIINYDNHNPLDLTQPLNLIQKNLDFKVTNDQVNEVIQEVNKEIKEPIIYIYNSHDQESYNYNKYQPYSIVPNVKLTSYILKEKLDDLGLYSIVENESISKILKDNNWIYKDSYKASRLLLEQRKKEYSSLKYYIDIHRDSANIEKTLLNYNNTNYARLMFIIGLENPNYEKNLSMVSTINNNVNNIIPDLSRGILKKGGVGVNGIYNQDFSSNTILIEVGGYNNTIDEVNNSINILAESIYKFIRGDTNEKEEL